MSKLKLITLDLDNTLWDVERIIIKAEADMVAWIEQHAPDSLQIYRGEALAGIREEVFNQHREQAHDLSFMRTAILTEVNKRSGYDDSQAQQLAKGAFEVFFEGRNRVKFFPGALDMLEELSRRYQIYALTNGNANIEKAGLGSYLHGAFSSADVGVKKPHADMFLAPLTTLELDAHQAVHVGDHLIDDISGAHNVGMHSVWVNFNDQQIEDHATKPTREISHLDELVTAIEEIATS